MRVLLAHNTYKHHGGEDAVLERESELLKKHGHDVKIYEVSNDAITSTREKLKTAWRLPYSIESRRLLSAEIGKFKPHVLHVHNFFPLLTPSIYDACLEHEVPVIQTLHNYRIICSGALLMRDGIVCEDCLRGSAYQSILHRCYRGSFLGTLSVARMIEIHRKENTWLKKINKFITLSNFAKSKFVEAGIPPEKIAVKPNFCDYNPPVKLNKERNGALFVGRLSPEKGISTLLEAWSNLETSLHLVGDGPSREEINRYNLSNVLSLGHKPKEDVSAEMSQAAFLVVPSLCYENFPLVVVEAFAHGLPVIASDLGSMAEIIKDGFTGLLFEAGNSGDLAHKIRWAVEHPEEMRSMGKNARLLYQEKYTTGVNYNKLLAIYEETIEYYNKQKGAVPDNA